MFSPQRTLHGLCFHCVDNTQNDFHTIYHIQWTFRRWHVSFSPAYRFNRLLMSVFHRLRSTQNLDLWTGFKTNEMHNYMRHVQTLIWKQIAQIIHAQFTLIIRFRWGFELWWALQWWILWTSSYIVDTFFRSWMFRVVCAPLKTNVDSWMSLIQYLKLIPRGKHVCIHLANWYGFKIAWRQNWTEMEKRIKLVYSKDLIPHQRILISMQTH